MICKYIEKTGNRNKKNCLLILPRPLFPIVGGYANKNYNLIPALAHQYNLHIVLFYFKKLAKEELDFYQEYTTSLVEIQQSIFASYLKSFFYLFLKEPIQVGYYYREFAAKYICKYADNMDIIIASLIRCEKYLRKISSSKIRILDMVDSIGMNYQRSYSKTTNLFWKLIYRTEGKRLLKLERKSVAFYDNTFFVNYLEEKEYKGLGNTTWLPHGVKESLFLYTKEDAKYNNSVVFLGKLNYRPNVEAVKWYIENVHIHVGKKIPLIVVGAYPVKELTELAKKYKNIVITGYCDDPYIYLNSCLATVAPMRTGGGIQNKVLEGMALGKINIISTLTAAPIKGGKDRKHFFIADTPQEYIVILDEIYENPTKYKYVGFNAKKLIHEYFTWESYCREYIRNIEQSF